MKRSLPDLRGFKFFYSRKWKWTAGIFLASCLGVYIYGVLQPSFYSTWAEVRLLPLESQQPAQLKPAFAAFPAEVLEETVSALALDDFFGLPRSLAADRLASWISMEPTGEKSTLRIQVKAPQPELSQMIVRTLLRKWVLWSVQERILNQIPGLSQEAVKDLFKSEFQSVGFLEMLPVLSRNREVRELTERRNLLQSLRDREPETKEDVPSPEARAMQKDFEEVTALLELAAGKALIAEAEERNRSGIVPYQVEPVRVSDRAEGPLNLWRDQGVLLAVPLLALLAVSIWFFCLYLWSDRIYHAYDLERYALQVPYLGAIPELSGSEKGQGKYISNLGLHSDQGALMDPFRYLRVAINFVASPGQARVIPVTGTMRGEGKTFTAFQLALSLALDKNKTLLLDADGRQSCLEKLFGVSRSRGISDVMEERGVIQSIIRESGIPNLHWAGAGFHTKAFWGPRASESFKRLLDQLRDQYDRIIIDAGSLDHGGFEVVRAAGQFVWVLRSGKSTAASMQRVLAMSGPGLRILGVVLNCIQPIHSDVSYESHLYYLKLSPPENPENNQD